MEIDPEKLTTWQRRIWDNAKAHGWHDTKLSPQHLCGLVMTEVAEAVEADRNGRRAKTEAFSQALTKGTGDDYFKACYKEYIKGSVEEEFADIVIRLLDMEQEYYGDEIPWVKRYWIMSQLPNYLSKH